MQNHETALISFGANLPSDSASAEETLRIAVGILHETLESSISAISRFWKTPAMPANSGPDFLNGAALLRTRLDPHQVLARLHGIEARLGRDRSTGRWSARVLDIDLIGYDDQILPSPAIQRKWVELPVESQMTDTPDTLILPHPRLQDRGFVLAPLAEIAPDWVHPVTGDSVSLMLSALPTSALAEMQPFRAQEILVYP